MPSPNTDEYMKVVRLTPTRGWIDPTERAVSIASFGYSFLSSGLESVSAESIPETYEGLREVLLSSQLSFGSPEGPDDDESRIPSSFMTLRDIIIDTYFGGIKQLDISEEEKEEVEEILLQEFPANWEKFRIRLLIAFHARNDCLNWVAKGIARNEAVARLLGVMREE